MAAAGAPYWEEDGCLRQGINNDPRKLRGMLKRLELPGWNNPAGMEANEANADRWNAIRNARNRACHPCCSVEAAAGRDGGLGCLRRLWKIANTHVADSDLIYSRQL